MRAAVLFVIVCLAGGCASPAQDRAMVATYSIVAVDVDTGEIGVAVQSRFLAVGAVVPWAEAGVGAVATQAWANPTYGPRGLTMMRGGATPVETVAALTTDDAAAARRQVAMIDSTGRAAAFTGRGCFDFAGHLVGDGYSVQGNILASPKVLADMAAAFEQAEGAGGELAERLLAALDAAQAAGGDKRGKQSAALLVVRQGWGMGGLSDRYRDLRVDDHAEPLIELRRIYELHKRLFPRPE